MSNRLKRMYDAKNCDCHKQCEERKIKQAIFGGIVQLPIREPPKIAQQEVEKQAEPEAVTDDMMCIKELCKKLNCPQMAFHIEKLTTAREHLRLIPNRDVFGSIFGTDSLVLNRYNLDVIEAFAEGSPSQTVNLSQTEMIEELEEEAAYCATAGVELLELLPENDWHGYFNGYEIMKDHNDFSMDDNKKCIEIGLQDTTKNLETYIRAGVRCFMIDLFKGSVSDKQLLVVRFRESEFNVAKEIGFPIASTLFARLSPRLQYTGYLETTTPETPTTVQLKQYEHLILTTDRHYAMCCNARRIYVNARFILEDTRPCDIILIGTEIQLQVERVMDYSLRCKVLKGGELRSRMPVLFNQRCQRFRMSWAELEDITFIKEVGINVLVSDMLGTEAYFNNLRENIRLLRCEPVRIFARVVLNNIDDDDMELEWAKTAYDGFLGELDSFRDGIGGDGNCINPNGNGPGSERILFLNPQIRALIEFAHRSHKPFIFDPTPLMNAEYVLDPSSYKHVLYHPDKYLFCSDQRNTTGLFPLLANALATSMPEEELNLLMPYCDESHTGSDTLALATVAASFELNASCIFVLGVTGRMAAKIACFRPKATIYFISSLTSATNHISIFHNVIMLYFSDSEVGTSHEKSVYKQLIYGLAYAVTMKALQHEDHAIFVFGQKPGQLFPDKYVAYKFDAKNFVEELMRFLS